MQLWHGPRESKILEFEKGNARTLSKKLRFCSNRDHVMDVYYLSCK